MLKTVSSFYCAIAVLSFCTVVRAENASDEGARIMDRFTRDINPLIAQSCMPCHNAEKKKGGVIVPLTLTLESFDKNEELWQKIREQIETKTMPPEERDPLKPEVLNALVKWVHQTSDYTDAHSPLDPGFVAPRRLNRIEYNNTIRDLVGVDFKPADSFPADDSGYGFDNIADVLTMSPLLVEKYLEAAEKIMDRAIPPPGSKPVRLVELQDFNLEGSPANIGDKLSIYSNGTVSLEHICTPGSEYEVRVVAHGDQAGPDPVLMEVGLTSIPRSSFKITAGSSNKAQTVSHRFIAKNSLEVLEFAFMNDFYDEKIADPRKRDRNLYIDSVEIVGPMTGPTPAMRKIFAAPSPAQLSDDENAKQIVQNFATRAFRRPATHEEVKRLLTLYTSSRQQGKSFEQSVKAPLMAVLISPNFLFRTERHPDGAKLDESGAWELNSYEIATRLSYFLWSTMPDEILMQAAAEDKLRDPVQREAQVRRMLKDPRSHALAVNFAGQWLELRNLDDVVRDAKKFPGFDNGLLKSMRREAEMFFENLIHEDRSVMDLLNADYTFLDDRLAKLYGLPPVGGKQFKKTSLAGTGRGGVLGMAAVLTVTSNPNRTSPVKRGQYVLAQLLGTPPPPAPPNVPKLQEKAKDGQALLPLRKRLEQHRADERCAACHARMDGIGFALERFDAIGKLRDKDGEFPIDDEGTIPGASTFKGLDGLKKVLMDRKDLMLRNLTRKLITYALGRGTGPGDRRSIDLCLKQAETTQYSFSGLTLAIINSKPFLKRRDPRGDE